MILLPDAGAILGSDDSTCCAKSASR